MDTLQERQTSCPAQESNQDSSVHTVNIKRCILYTNIRANPTVRSCWSAYFISKITIKNFFHVMNTTSPVLATKRHIVTERD
jgi:hypothetical protein